MAFQAGGSFPASIVPMPNQVTVQDNYLDFNNLAVSQWAQQYLPELYEQEVERYGNRTLSGFLRMVGAEMPMTSDQVIWSEQNRLHIAYDNCSVAAGANSTVTIPGNLVVTGETTTVNVTTTTTSNGVVFEGTTGDGHDGTLKSVVAGADVTYTLPNVTGHVALFAADPSTTTISATPAELNLLDGITTLSGSNTGDEPDASASVKGIVELATAAEVITGTDTSRVVTADTLSAKSVVCDIDVSSLTDANIVTITHNLGTADILVQVYDKTTEANIMCDIARTTDDFSTASTSVVSIDFGTAPPNDCRALITSLAGATAGSIAYT